MASLIPPKELIDTWLSESVWTPPVLDQIDFVILKACEWQRKTDADLLRKVATEYGNDKEIVGRVYLRAATRIEHQSQEVTP